MNATSRRLLRFAGLALATVLLLFTTQLGAHADSIGSGAGPAGSSTDGVFWG